MARQGEKIVTETDIQSRLHSLQSQIDSILDFLVFQQGSGRKKNFMFQYGVQQFAGTGTIVTFNQAFKVGTVPTVVGTSRSKFNCFTLDGAPTATQFTGCSKIISDGTGNASYCYWIAIGERG